MSNISNSSTLEGKYEPHLCFWLQDEKNHQPIWKQLAKSYTQTCNISGIFPTPTVVKSIADIHGDFHCLQRQLVEVTKVLKLVPCVLHDKSYSKCPPMCATWIGDNTNVVIL